MKIFCIRRESCLRKSSVYKEREVGPVVKVFCIRREKSFGSGERGGCCGASGVRGGCCGEGLLNQE